MAIEGAMFDWIGVYFQDIVKAPKQLIILGYTSFILMMATGRFLGDYLIVRFGRKKLYKRLVSLWHRVYSYLYYQQI